MNELPQWASVWLRVTVIDTDVWTTEGSPMTTFETPCGETFRVFSEGLEIVPVSPDRADREAVVEIIRRAAVALRDDDPSYYFEDAADDILALFRATPEPERADSKDTDTDT